MAFSGYRHVKYDAFKKQIHLWGWDDKGTRIKRELPFQPYLMVPFNEGKYQGIDGTKLRKRTFEKISDRRNYFETYDGVLYNHLSPEKQFLLEQFGKTPLEGLVKHPLRMFYLDIEVYSPQEFPNAEEAKHPINLMCVYDSFTDEYRVWGLKEFDIADYTQPEMGVSPEQITYTHCHSEEELLKKFLRFWRANFPDVVITWNGSKFDIPYIVHRLEHLFGVDAANKLSPMESLSSKEVTDKFANQYIEYTIHGVSHIDYMLLQKYYARNETESDRLDYVAKTILNIGKLEYDGDDVTTLSEKDWNRFVEYNIQDVHLMVLIDQKTKYMDVARYSSVAGLCNIEKAMGKLAIIEGVIAKQAYQNDMFIPTYKPPESADKIPGGYVKLVPPGLYKDVVSYDANSLYPNCIITLNISPETKIGKVLTKDGDNVTFAIKGATKTLPQKDFLQLLRKNQCAISAAGIIFSQKKKGILPEFVDYLYEQRKTARSKMNELEKEMAGLLKDSKKYKELDMEVMQYDSKQYLYKILLNSVYGAFANRFFVLFDQDCAKSITLTGQAMIRKTSELANQWMEEQGLEKKDRVIGIDTDSNYVSFEDYNRLLEINLHKGVLCDKFIDAENKLGDYLNHGIEQWARNALLSTDPRFIFKREAVCPSAFWTGKKHYALWIINTEGIPVDKIKISGMRVAKAEFSPAIKKLIIPIIETILRTTDEKEATNAFRAAFESFRDLDPKHIITRKNIKTLNKYATAASGMNIPKGTPQHVKGSLIYNEIIHTKKLNHKYPLIEQGNKVSLAYVHKNPYGISIIAYKEELPPEFGLEIDYKKTFQATMMKQMKTIYTAIGWQYPDVTRAYTYDLDDLLS
jgi:DNA polymerase elongation subunit (family B)